MHGLTKLCASLVVLLVIAESVNAGVFWWHHRQSHHQRERDQVWWRGPNVCVTTKGNNKTATAGTGYTSAADILRDMTELSHLSYRYFMNSFRGPSRRWEHRIICESLSDDSRRCERSLKNITRVVKVVTTYSCCYGYSRNKGDFGCPTKLELQSLLETAENLGATTFLQLLETTELDVFLKSGNYTVFVPTNRALTEENSISQSAALAFQNSPLTLQLSPDELDIISGHVISGFKRTSSFFNEELINTLSNPETTIRINFFESPERHEKIVTANCVVLNSTDNLASDGVIHLVDKVLPPAKDSLLNIISSDTRLTYLASAIKQAGLQDMLEQGSYTILAPDDEAFLKIAQPTLNGILYDEKRLTALLENHILPATICSAAVFPGRHQIKSLLGENIRLTNENGSLSFGGAKAIELDRMATNGVIQVINQVILTDKALTVADLLEPSLSELVNEAGVAGIFGSINNITLFAPSAQAIETLPEEIRKDPEALRRALMYHVASGERCFRQLKKNSPSTLDALNELDRLNINTACSSSFYHEYHRMCMVNVQCVPITDSDRKASNGVVHMIDQFLQPPTMTLLELIKADSALGTLLKLVEVAGMAEELESLGETWTLLAPTDDAFRSYGARLDALLSDPEMARRTLDRHTIQGHKCCANFYRNWWWDDKPMVRGVRVDHCDMAATNGVLHVVGRAIRAV